MKARLPLRSVAAPRSPQFAQIAACRQTPPGMQTRRCDPQLAISLTQPWRQRPIVMTNVHASRRSQPVRCGALV